MKSRFTTVDIKAVLKEINIEFAGLRLSNVYDVDNKTYLLKFSKPESKKVLLIESGTRLHITEYDWPKSHFPSSFAMKLRKHLKSRRLERIVQLGNDRIVSMQFGSGEAAYYLILELYDRGNVILSEHSFIILNVLRPRTDNSQDVKFSVGECYRIDLAKPCEPLLSIENLRNILLSGGQKENLKKLLNPHLSYGPAVIDHCLQLADFSPGVCVGRGFDLTCDLPRLAHALEEAENIMKQSEDVCCGYIIQKVEVKPQRKQEDEITQPAVPEELLVYDEFHPFLYAQCANKRYIKFDSFNKAVDEFFSKIEAQKIEMKTLQAEKGALKKLENVKKDHMTRLAELQKEQEMDQLQAYLIESNLSLVDKCIAVINSALANQLSWNDIWDLIKEAQSHGDPVAKVIHSLTLSKNHMIIMLRDPFDEDNLKPTMVEIDLGLSAFSNARKFYDAMRQASTKEQKTLDASGKALKSAERKTTLELKEMKVTASISKARKVMWFEKFNWCISSENYLVIAGRDGQQNELLVRRYLKAGDRYVHADIHGASSVIVKNPSGAEVPPKTLNEAGTMAICHSAAWQAKVVTSAWWVYHHQVSKTAPSGEYLTTGSFMIRGKKNYLPPSYLVYGFGLLFRVDEDSLDRHRGERRVRALEDDVAPIGADPDSEHDHELELGSSSESSEEEPNKLPAVAIENLSVKADLTSTAVVSTLVPTLERFSLINDSISTELPSNSQETTVDVMSTADDIKASDAEDESAFPDTQIDLQHVKGSEFELRQRTKSQLSSSSLEAVPAAATTKPVLSRKQRKELKKKKFLMHDKDNGETVDTHYESDDDTQTTDGSEHRVDHQQTANCPGQEDSNKRQRPQPLKRGHKGKLKKIEKKYADQDEDEREMRMRIIQSVPNPNKVPSKKKSKNIKNIKQHQAHPNVNQKKAPSSRLPVMIMEGEGKEVLQEFQPADSLQTVVPDEDDEEKAEEVPLETDVLEYLTGLPVPEDSLLYVVPFCAPYSVLQNFKFKVKLMPGSTKRGKAAKSAMQAFLMEKTLSQRERDLIKSLKDVDVSRNMPGKVKVTSSIVHKTKKKK